MAALSSGMAAESVLAPFWSAAAVSWGQNELQNYPKSNERCAPYFREQEGSQHDSKLCFEIMYSKYVSNLCFEIMVRMFGLAYGADDLPTKLKFGGKSSAPYARPELTICN